MPKNPPPQTPTIPVVTIRHEFYAPPDFISALSYISALLGLPAHTVNALPTSTTPLPEQPVDRSAHALAGAILALPEAFFADAAQQGPMGAIEFVALATTHGLSLAGANSSHGGIASAVARHPAITKTIHGCYRVMRTARFNPKAQGRRCIQVVDLRTEPDARQRELKQPVTGYHTVTTDEWRTVLMSMPLSAFEHIARHGDTLTSQQMLNALSTIGHIDITSRDLPNAHKALKDLMGTDALMIDGHAVTFAGSGQRFGVHVAPAIASAA
jgi:hypothetical protein